MIPKLGLGVVGLVSWRVYHQVLVLPKSGHPTSSQYVLAFARLGMAKFSVFPLTGHPVSVIQTGLLPTAAWVAAKAAWNRLLPSSMLLVMVFWKYGYASIPMKSHASMTELIPPSVLQNPSKQCNVSKGFMGINLPASPSIDVTNRNVGQARALDSVPKLADVRGNCGCVGSDTSVGSLSSWRGTVEILTSNRDTNNQLGEVITVLGNRGAQSCEFGREGTLATRCPEAEEKRCTLVDGSRNGLCGFVRGASTLLQDC